MEDNLFDKIKESSDKYSDYQMPDNAISEFRKYSKKRESSLSSLKYYIIGALLSLLIGSNIYWLWNSSSNKNQESTSKVTTTKTDTVYITKYINSEKDIATNETSTLIDKEEYDALIKSEQRVSSLEKSMTQLQSKLSQLENKSHQVAGKNITKEADTKANVANLTINNLIETELNNTKLSPNININRSIMEKLTQIALLDYDPTSITSSYPSSNEISITQPIYINLKKKQSVGEFLRPKTLSVISQLGLRYEKGDKLQFLNGKQIGIGITTLFSDKYRGHMILSIAKAKGEIEDNDEIPAYIPSVSTPEGAVLDELYISSLYRSISVGMDYLLKPIRLFRPYIGINYSLAQQRYFDIEYKYIDQNQELNLSADNSTPSFNNHLGISVGSDINLTQNFDVFINLNYSHSLNGTIRSLLLLNTGIQYHF